MGAKHLTLQDYLDLYEATGVRFLGTEKPKSTNTRIEWLCSCGREWVTSYSEVKAGKKCRECGLIKQGLTQRNTIEDYRAAAESKGLLFLGDSVGTTKDRVLWGCPKGHKWEENINHIREGRGCPDCKAEVTGKKKINRNPSASDMHEAASKRGFRWLGKEVPRYGRATKWECLQCGYIWLANYYNIGQEKSGCPRCSNRARRTKDDYESLAASQGIAWIDSELPPNTGTPTGWKCSDLEHPIWRTSFENITRGTGCPFCAKVAPKVKEDYLEIARIRGLVWEGGEIPENTTIKTKWRCLKGGHPLQSSYRDIAGCRGSGCRQCFRKELAEKLTIKEDGYIALANELGWKWLGTEIKSAKHYTEWECDKGHKIKAPYTLIKQGQRCNQCAQSRGEQEVARVLKRLGVEFEIEKRFPECKDKRALPFDFYFEIEEVRVLCEYDGEGHYTPHRFRDGQKHFERTLKHDAIKDRFAQENGFVLIRIAYTRFREIEAILTEEVRKYREGDCSSLPIYANYKQLSFL